MMLESELRKRWIFSYSGGFSVAHGSRSSIESLNYSADLLQNNSNLVLMFPQAKMHSIYNDNLKFERGIEYIAKRNQPLYFWQHWWIILNIPNPMFIFILENMMVKMRM